MDDTAEKDFNDIPRDDRAPAVRMHMEAGGSIRSAAREFSSTPGAIAGIMRDYGIPSKNRPGFAKAEKSSSGVLIERTMPKPPRTDLLKPKRAKVPALPGLAEARSEASRCEYPREHCPYEAEVGSPFCPLHQGKEKDTRR
jgi:transposase-like protein